MNDWNEIWQNKEIIKTNCLDTILSVSGFTENGGTKESWLNYIDNVVKIAQITPDDKVFEFGCGCGGVVLPLLQYTNKISGIDISEQFVENVRYLCPNGDFWVGDFLEIDIPHTYNVILSNSVFQYLETNEQANQVMQKMASLLEKNGKIVILDINNIEKMEDYEKFRASQKGMSLADYKALYNNLSHTFYEQSFFEDFAKKNNFKIKIMPQHIEGFFNSQFRFNIFMEC